MSRTQLLYRLQSLDSKIDKAKQSLAQVESQLGESEVLKKARRQTETAAQNLRKIQTKLKDLELEVKGLSDKIADHEKLLYSGKNMSAKEAANLQDEINALKRWHTTREEFLLEAMVEAEEVEESLSQAQATLAQIETDWSTTQVELTAQQDALQAEIGDLLQQRPSLSEPIEAGDLSDYEDLRPKKAGVAVAAVKNSVCQACGMIASNNKIRIARSGTELVYCNGCGRILYIL